MREELDRPDGGADAGRIAVAARRDDADPARSWTSARRRPRPRGSPARPRCGRSTGRRSPPISCEFVAADDARRVADGVVPESVELPFGLDGAPPVEVPGVRRSNGRVPGPGRPRRRAARRHPRRARLQDRSGVLDARPTARTRSTAAPGSSSRSTRRPPRQLPRRHRRRGGVLVRVVEGRVRPGSVPARRHDRGAIPRRGRPHRRQHRRGLVPGGAG